MQGVVTLDLVDVPLDQALRMLALPGGYEVHKIDDFYFIGTADPASPSFRNFAVTATYQLQHLSAADVAELMPDIYRKYVNTGLYRNIVTIRRAAGNPGTDLGALAAVGSAKPADPHPGSSDRGLPGRT